MVLHPQAIAVLQEYLDTLPDRSPNAFFFPAAGLAPRLHRVPAWRAIKTAFEHAGLCGVPGELGTHTLRKTFARLIYSAIKHDLVRIGYALRHKSKSVATTVEYPLFPRGGSGCAYFPTQYDRIQGRKSSRPFQRKTM